VKGGRPPGRTTPRAPGSSSMRALALALAMALPLFVGACASVTVRRQEAAEERTGAAGLVHVRWRTELHAHKLFEPRPEECASGALAGGRLVLGSRAGMVVGVRTDDGAVEWATDATGGIDSDARFDAARGQVYLGADDGSVYAVDARTGKIRWTYRAKGAVDRAPEVGPDAVYVATAADRVIALDAGTGKWKWQYERETPDGFTIHGYGGPRLRGRELLIGFADGNLVSLQAATGEVVWARSLASASEQFVDVDSTPITDGKSLFAASYSGGVYGLDAGDGGVRWRLGVEGAGPISLYGRHLYFTTPRQGLHAVTTEGQIVWRQGLAESGDVTAPLAVGRYLVFSGSRAGMYILNRADGELLEIFNPGQGVCAAATLDPSGTRIYVLANGGTLYALDLG
jgi:outer membrane protein assembly factor BamB